MTVDAVSQRSAHATARVLSSAGGPIAAAILYYLGAKAAFAIGTLTQQFAPFWPPNVVLLCALLLAPRRQWPWFILAAFPAHLVAEGSVAMPLFQGIAAFVSNVAVATLNAVALRRLLRSPPTLGSLRNVSLYLLFAVVVNPASVALASGFEPILVGADLSGYWQFCWRWYLSNALGNLTLTPIFLAWIGAGQPLAVVPPSRRRVVEAVMLALAFLLACLIAFATPHTASTENLFPALYLLPLPIVLAAAVRFGGRGASGMILLITVAVLFAAMHGSLPFGYSVLSAQLLLAMVAIPVLILAALVEELQRSNVRLSGVLDGISDCYFTINRDGQIIAINQKGADWWGVPSAEKLIGQHYRKLASPRDQEVRWLDQVMAARTAVRDEIFSEQGRWLDVSAYPSPEGMSVFCRDITERRLAEQAARSTQQLLQSSLDALAAEIAILDQNGTIIAANAGWKRAAEFIAKTSDAYLVGTNFVETCERGTRPHRRPIAAGLRRLISGEIEEFHHEFQSDFFEGAWFQLRGTRFGFGESLRLVIANEDISEVKQSESALRRLTSRMMRLEDDTRRRIARELHDSTAQNLLGASLGIGRALRAVPRLKAVAKAALEEARDLIDESQREIRTVSYLLHPPMLDAAGLPAALRWLGDGFTKRAEIRVDFDFAPNLGRLPEEIEAALFRIAQEGLTNVHRHSGSTTALIGLRIETVGTGERQAILTIEDEGKGMPAEVIEGRRRRRSAVERIAGVGLAGMRERLFPFGGRLEIVRKPHGTAVRAIVPLSAGSEPQQHSKPASGPPPAAVH